MTLQEKLKKYDIMTKGGNWVGATAEATHIPTGTTVRCDEFMSPYQNEEVAVERLIEKIIKAGCKVSEKP